MANRYPELKHNMKIEQNKLNHMKNEREIEKTHESSQKTKNVKLADFSEEFNGRLAKISILNQPLLIGKIVEARRYWIKVETADNKTIYLNKAYIISIEPVGVKP
jgi:ATP-dependent 26S proteasome regulatory subunit